MYTKNSLHFFCVCEDNIRYLEKSVEGRILSII